MAMPPNTILILIVDDFSTMRKIVKNVLRELGYTNVLEAEHGIQALNILRQNPAIEFVISDWNMPNMTGLELLRAVRADEKLKSLPFLMVTAEAEKENIIAAVKSGVNNYIVKPFNAVTMKEKIDKIFTPTKASA